MRPLHGLGVLVTRPEHQAAGLCRLLEAAGADTTQLPAITIAPAADAVALAARIATYAAFDCIVFTSANAVRFGKSLLEGRPEAPLAAIGPATARALEAAGRPVTVTPSARFDSESLLADPRLAAAGRRILLVKGLHGRELMQDELTRRGAEVVVADVYRREPARPDAAALAAVSAKVAVGAIHVITATSVDVAVALLEMAELRAGFERLHWLVPGARVATALREHGVTAPTVAADSALDQDLVTALVRWRSKVSGA